MYNYIDSRIFYFYDKNLRHSQLLRSTWINKHWMTGCHWTAEWSLPWYSRFWITIW